MADIFAFFEVSIEFIIVAHAHVKAITGKATKNMWWLLRFQDMGASLQPTATANPVATKGKKYPQICFPSVL